MVAIDALLGEVQSIVVPDRLAPEVSPARLVGDGVLENPASEPFCGQFASGVAAEQSFDEESANHGAAGLVTFDEPEGRGEFRPGFPTHQGRFAQRSFRSRSFLDDAVGPRDHLISVGDTGFKSVREDQGLFSGG